MPVDSTPAARRLAALSLGAQAVVLVGFAVFYIYELSIGEGSDAVRVVMSALVIALGGIGLAVVTRGWLRGSWWPRTPTIVWSLLLLPVGWGLIQRGRRPSWGGSSSVWRWSRRLLRSRPRSRRPSSNQASRGSSQPESSA